jgi:YfiR/HmsC-like
MSWWISSNQLQSQSRSFLPAVYSIGQTILWVVLSVVLAGPLRSYAAETLLTEYQVKSLFLMNFIKYVDWPPGSFAADDTPIIIGLYGEDKFGDALKNTVEGRIISGRRITIQPVQSENDSGKCHILFVSDSEKNRLDEILAPVKTLPVLTVGETDRFMEQGGVINFVKKEGKIRLEINLTAALEAKLEISSKLLRVADVVKGKLK